MTAMKLSVLMPLAALLLGCSTSALLSARNNVDQCAHVDQDLVTSHGGHNTNSGHIGKLDLTLHSMLAPAPIN